MGKRVNAILVGGMLIFMQSLFHSCSWNAKQDIDIKYDVRDAVNQVSSLNLQKEISSVSYVPLETTNDDESLIDGVLDYAVTENHIYILPAKEARVVLFDRNGHFVKTLIREGQGPEEFSGLLFGIQAVEASDRLYLYGNMVWEYTLDGTFIKSYPQKAPMIYERRIGEELFAAVAMPFTPFATNSFGLGVFDKEGNLLFNKNNFYSDLLEKEKTGFTVNMAMTLSDAGNSVLFKLGSNDTVFRITQDSIKAACILDLQNSNEEIVRSLNITDFSDMLGERRSGHEIFVQDLFETSRCYYLRCRYNQAFYVISLNKENKEILVEKCEQPGTLKEMGDVTLQHGMLGSRSFQNFPIWGRTQGDELIQIITPSELALYREKCNIEVPKALSNIDEDSNPIFIFYKLKKE